MWAVLAHLEDIQHWSDAVAAARCEGQLTSGVGAERVCDLRGGIQIRERWIAWEEGSSFTYEGLGVPMVARAVNTWTVTPEGDRSLLTSRAEVVFKGRIAGRLLEPLAAWQARRMGARSLAAIGHMAATGRPPEGRHADLPRLAPSC